MHGNATGNTMLTLTNTEGTDLSSSKISAGIAGDSSIKIGDSVTLIKNDNGLITSGRLREGVSLDYTFDVKPSSDNKSIGTTLTTVSINSVGSTMLELGYALLPDQDGRMSADIALKRKALASMPAFPGVSKYRIR